jgi:adenylate cyclase
MERRLAAILLTDIVGYSRLTGLDEEGTIAHQRAHREEVFAPKIARYGGRIVKTTGDGMLVEFPSVVDAVKCALEVQTELVGRDADVPEDRRIKYRIGINLGDIVIDGDDILGDGVNVAARLEALATPGGICVSGNVYDHLAGKLEVVFEDAGEQTIKNVPRPIRVLHWHGGRAARHPNDASKRPLLPDKPSIAVLPFTNLSGDPEQEYFADGIAEDIMIALSKLSQISVIGRNSSFSYKGQSMGAHEIASDLGVRFIVEGSIRKSGDRVRISSHLVDCETSGHIWADKFDRILTDIFDVQDEVTQRIAGAMAVALTADERERLRPSGPRNLEAYNLFMKGRAASREYFKEANDIAIIRLNQALDLEPDYSSAHAFLTFTYLADYFNQWRNESKQSLDKAEEHALLAVEANGEDPYAYLALGKVHMWRGRHEEGIAAHRRTIELDPNFSVAYASMGYALHFAGHCEQAIKLIEKGMQLDPHHPSTRLHWLALPHFQLGRYREAIELLERLLSAKPDMDISRIVLAAAYGHLGCEEDAQVEWRMARQANPSYSLESRKAVLPYKDPGCFDRIVEGLRLGGINFD